MTKISRSPERDTFRRDKYIERRVEDGTMHDEAVAEMLKYYEISRVQKLEREDDPEWQKNNLEYDLRTTDWILKKVRESDTYAQNLYAAMCNTDFTKNDVWPILKEESWCCSWRYAGGIIADMRQSGDYMDWYCSGYAKDSVQEGHVTDEIREDLLKLGWLVKTYGLE